MEKRQADQCQEKLGMFLPLPPAIYYGLIVWEVGTVPVIKSIRRVLMLSVSAFEMLTHW